MPTLLERDPPLHYQRAGNGDAVVLIHGLGANLAFWFMSIGRRLARDYTIITYDLRGHGRSGMAGHGYRLPDMVGDLEDLLSYLQIERAHLVGHSFGARVALAHAIMHPRRVATLTVADTQAKCLQPPTRLGDWPHWPAWKQQLLAQGHASLPGEHEYITFELLAHFNELSGGFAHGDLAAHRKRRPSPSLRRRDMGRRGAQRWEQLMANTTARAELADERPLSVEAIRRIAVPTLAMYGEFSHCLPTCRRLQRLIGTCEVAIVPGAGHFHPAVKPRRFIRLLNDFLRRHGALGPGSLAARA